MSDLTKATEENDVGPALAYGLYAKIRPGADDSSWRFTVYRKCWGNDSDQVWRDTNVRTYGNARSKERAMKKAQKQLDKCIHAYDNLERAEGRIP